MPSTPRATTASAVYAALLLAMAQFGSSAYVMDYVGCYSTSTPLKNVGSYTYQSASYCQGECAKTNSPVLGLSAGDTCWCGSELPPASAKTGNSSCDTPCQGWPDDSCGGGTSFFTVWLTGEQTNVPTYSGGDDTSSSTSTTSATSTQQTPSVVTSTGPGKTVIVTKPAEAPSTQTGSVSNSSGGGSNVAGIAAGVVVGVVAAVAIVTGIFFFLRHRRRKAAQEEYARSNQIGDFMRGGERKPPNTGYSTHSDSRLDPEANKRNSVGSLADNQDYSRRILRVANPDRS